MALCCTLHVTALTVLILALESAGTGVERLVEEDTLDLRVELSVGHHNTSLSSGTFVIVLC